MTEYSQNDQGGGGEPGGRADSPSFPEPGAPGQAVTPGGVGLPERLDAEDVDEITAMVEQPAKVMRIGTMIKQLLEEVRAAPLDEAGRQRLRDIHESSIKELEQGLSPDLRDELERLTLPFGNGVPSEAELRIAQAQLVGWLEGLFHGIQTALFAQQMAARAQLEQMRGRALPGHVEGQPGQVVIGPGGQVLAPGPFGRGNESGEQGTGQYL
ncbi:MAG: bacterial proteasome activator family protein [Actinobacteria bacterium]|nr:bacterial proteasome activator family protein [Actinomycetota bacterium]